MNPFQRSFVDGYTNADNNDSKYWFVSYGELCLLAVSYCNRR